MLKTGKEIFFYLYERFDVSELRSPYEGYSIWKSWDRQYIAERGKESFFEGARSLRDFVLVTVVYAVGIGLTLWAVVKGMKWMIGG